MNESISVMGVDVTLSLEYFIQKSHLLKNAFERITQTYNVLFIFTFVVQKHK